MADLIFYENLKNSNDNYKYVLTVIDTFSRFAWTRPLKSKRAEEVSENLDSIIMEMPHPPRKFCSDRGTGLFTFSFRPSYIFYFQNFLSQLMPYMIYLY